MNIFLSRYFEAGNSGWIFYLSNNFSLLLIVAGLTMESAINYYSSQKAIDDNALTWFALAWTFVVSFAVMVLLWFYFGRYKDTSFITRGQYLYYALCYIAGIQLTNIFTVLFYANKNFFLPNFLMVLVNVVVIILIPKQLGTQNTNASLFINLYFGFFIVNGLVLAIAFIIKKKTWRKFSFPTIPNLRLIVRYALMALAANVIFFLVYRIDYWFVKRFCTLQELGNYIQISKLAQMLLIIPSIVSSVIFPHTAGGMQRGEMKENILRIGRLTTLMYVVLFALLASTGYWMFPLVFGNTFTLMYLPFLFLLPGVWALSNLYLLSAYFAGVNKVRVNIQGAILALVVILAGDFIFIPGGGIVAAAVVSSVGYFVNFGYSFLMLRGEHPVSFASYVRLEKEDIRWFRKIMQP
jgi:O-antigen/teichoic acid export membrane protein